MTSSMLSPHQKEARMANIQISADWYQSCMPGYPSKILQNAMMWSLFTLKKQIVLHANDSQIKYNHSSDEVRQLVNTLVLQPFPFLLNDMHAVCLTSTARSRLLEEDPAKTGPLLSSLASISTSMQMRTGRRNDKRHELFAEIEPREH